MKTFIASICTFILLLLLIMWNCRFVDRTAEALASSLEAMPHCEEANDALNALDAYWQQHHTLISFSVSFDEISELDDCMAQMRAAITMQDALQFETARLLALNAVEDMRRLERISWDLIL